VTWGLTILKQAPNPDNAVKFLQLLFGPQGVAIQRSTGPTPIEQPEVSRVDFHRLPPALRPLVQQVVRGH
jgi:ABC-type Fe3+ transport system substrate-binding protein